MTDAVASNRDNDVSPSDADDITVMPHWTEWRQHRCLRAREALFLYYGNYVTALAASMFGARPYKEAEFGDFRQWAFVGLLEAIDRFDPERKFSFKAYATPRIRGAVLDGLKNFSDAQAQVSFRVRMRQERLASIKDRLNVTQPLSALAEVATGLAVGLLLEGTSLFIESEHIPSPQPGGYEAVAWTQRRRAIVAAVDTLPSRLQRVIRLHYFHGVPFGQIATMFDVTPARISQLHRAALQELRNSALPSPHHWSQEHD